MTKKDFFDIVKFHYMSVQNPTCIRWESEDGGKYRMTICDTFKGESVRYMGTVQDGCWGYEYNPAPYVGYMPCNV